jgi:Uma2 family endonuclease
VGGVATKLGLADHGKRVGVAEFESAEFEEGYRYELIEGRLYVSPQPHWSEVRLENWLLKKLMAYSDRHPEVINYVINKVRVVVPGSRGRTTPEPDLAAYADAPLDDETGEVNWEQVSPVLVAEVLYASDPFKDLVRNVNLYLRVPSIREYWILDARLSIFRPVLIVHRRRGRQWAVSEYGFGQRYKTDLLPGFTLRMDPRRNPPSAG